MEREHKYTECLRNHAASLGSYAQDGCREFTLDEYYPTSLKCAACGCHRNFHRKISCTSSSRGHHRDCETTMESADGGGGRRPQAVVESPETVERSGKKRFRTKFSPEQKEKMLAFAEKLGWKLLGKDQEDDSLFISLKEIKF